MNCAIFAEKDYYEVVKNDRGKSLWIVWFPEFTVAFKKSPSAKDDLQFTTYFVRKNNNKEKNKKIYMYLLIWAETNRRDKLWAEIEYLLDVSGNGQKKQSQRVGKCQFSEYNFCYNQDFGTMCFIYSRKESKINKDRESLHKLN